MPSESVKHLLAPKSGSLKDIICDHTQCSPPQFEKWLNLGAIYLWKKRALQNRDIREGDYIRVHTQPKRYNVVSIDWGRAILFENDQFVLVDKPKNIPVHATLDNHKENLCQQLLELGQSSLYVTQRLDIPTQGLMILAKTKAFQREFNTSLMSGKVKKIYDAHIPHPIKPQLYTHYMRPSDRAPKEISDKACPGWKECLLKVLKTAPLTKNFLATIDLITGRTHQIRAQMAYLSAPLVGDILYGSDQPSSPFYLRSCRLAFHSRILNRKFAFELPTTTA